MTLDPIQLRVLGALIEKEITTPENYPLSLNSLSAACNQRSSREPVLDLAEDEVRQAVHSLEDMDIVAPVRDARVPKYEHRIRTVLNLRRDETAILCLLLLRGPQTPGELRSRADRMYSFDDLAAVQATLERLAARGSNTAARSDLGQNVGAISEALVVMLPRQPGSRESRFAHLLGGPVTANETPRTPSSTISNPARISTLSDTEPAPFEADLITRLEATFASRTAALEDAVKQLQSRLEALEAIKSESAPPLEPLAESL